jgi:hypothetical protein
MNEDELSREIAMAFADDPKVDDVEIDGLSITLSNDFEIVGRVTHVSRYAPDEPEREPERARPRLRIVKDGAAD